MTHEAVPAHRFYLKLAGVVEAAFSEVSGLQLEIETQDLEVGGRNDVTIRLPGRMKTSNLTLKRGITRSNEFLKWLMGIGPGHIERRTVMLVLLDVRGEQLLSWEFTRAYPIKWVGPTLTADGATLAIETVELAHEGFKVT